MSVLWIGAWPGRDLPNVAILVVQMSRHTRLMSSYHFGRTGVSQCL